MKKTTLTLLLLFAMAANAQTFEWLKSQQIEFNSNPEMIGYATACDPMGNVYTTGFKQNPFNYESIMGDIFYNKYNSAGELQFSKTFSGNATVYNAVSDTEGNIVLAIGYVNSIIIDDIALLTEAQGVNALVVKFDKDGNLLWQQQMVIEDSYDCRVHAITTDAQNNIYVGCYDFQHSYIRKFSPAGNLLMTITQSQARAVTSLSVDNQGNIYAAGSCADPGATFAGVPMPPAFSYNIFLVKYTPAGTFQWVKYVDDITCPEPQVVAVSPDQVYFSSYLFDNYTFDGIETEGPLTMFSDVFITKLNAQGIFQWVSEVPGAGFLDPGSRKSLTADAQGNVYFAGATRGTINWTSEIVTTTGIAYNTDAIVLKYNPDGVLQMAKTAGGDTADRIDAIAVNATGAIFVTGMCSGTASFDSFTIEAELYESWPFVAKLTQNALAVAENQDENIVLYPNPSPDFIHIANASRDFSGTIYNMLGQQIKNFTIGVDKPLDIRELSKGTYLVRVTDLKTVKFVKS